MREAVSTEERLIATLRYFPVGQNYEDLKFSCAISSQLLRKIIPQTCWGICKTLKDEYLKFPDTEEKWQSIANYFQTLWQFNNCLGAIDGKHVQIVKSANSNSYFYNYKGTFSVVMLAIVNKLNIPNPTMPEGTNLQLPYAFVGDQVFPLMENLMKPYPDKNFSRQEKILNYRLSRVQRVIENAFGIMPSVFRIFHSVIGIDINVGM
ncbi:uncharacterized protein LOC143184746 [Calliopsis andreniformis]|uniref:uncharacterized protein LOC143184746 n=1 Tax=Calliopsis andreniformis TaxID=337506 RepID=UPI003FCDA9A6